MMFRYPRETTTFQKVVDGLRILQGYLSKENPGDISVGPADMLYASGVDREALGGDDRKQLKALGWTWNARFNAWEYQL